MEMIAKFDQWLDKTKEFAPALLRYGLAAVYLWFGINQLFLPQNFIGYLPTFMITASYAKTFVILNGVFEVIAGLMLLVGVFTRIIALLLSLHLLAITIELGYGDVAVRDFGLTVATISIFLRGADNFCLEKKWKKQTN